MRAAVDELGYVPLQAAQQLRIGRSGLLGMTVINITNPFFADLVSGAEDAAGTGVRVLVGNSDDDEEKEREYFRLFERVQVEGALVSPFGEDGERLARQLARSIPVVLVDRVDDEGVLDSVSFDDVAGRSHGRRAPHLARAAARLAFLGAREEVRQVRERLEGVRQAVEAHPGVSLELMWSQRTTLERGVSMGARIAELAESERPDGVVTTNDHLACGVVHGLLRGGMRVPEDVAVVGYDDIEFAAVAAVPLTSVRQPARAMGRAAGLRLMQLMSGEVQASGHAIRFEPELRCARRPSGTAETSTAGRAGLYGVRSTPFRRCGSRASDASRSTSGSSASGASWNTSGRRNRRIAVAPTDVCSDVVAGHGPPCCCDQVTATPVGQPANSTRPALSCSTESTSATSSPGSECSVAVRLPGTASSARCRSSGPS